jgi:hypothetical protein
VSASMAEGIAEVLRAHGEWRYTNGAGWAIDCSACGEPVGNVIAHQAEVLAANGYGKLEPWPECAIACGACKDCLERPE